MELVTNVAMLLFSAWLICAQSVTSLQLPSSSLKEARALDALLQGYAYQAFNEPRTGIVYDGAVPSNLTGIKVSAMRLRSGSLRTRGVPSYKEFQIPIAVLEQPYAERLVLVYHNLGNWSMSYYPLQGYTYLAPVLGLLAYDALDLTAKNLPELDIVASRNPISIKFSGLRQVPDGSVPKCILFHLNGTVNLSNLLSDNICTTFRQGHFSIVIESIAPTPSPPIPENEEKKKKKSNSKMWIIVGSVVGGVVLLVMLVLLVLWVRRYNRRKRMNRMERAADAGEALHMARVGNTRAPAATGTRTQPTLETEYVP